MKVTISAVSKKEMPSKFEGGSTWSIVRVRLQGHGEEVFELDGFGQKEKDKLVAGSILKGYFSEKTWQGKQGVQVTKTFNKITAEYVYDLLMEMKGTPVLDKKVAGSTGPAKVAADDWGPGPGAPAPVDDDPGF